MNDLTPEERLLLKYQENYELAARDLYKVRNHETAKIEPLVFRPGQNIMHDVAKKRKAEKGNLKALLLKNRRFGGSTYIGGRGYHRASMHFNQSIFIIGHETDSTTTLYRMVVLMQEQNPIKPTVLTVNINELRFDTPKGEGLKSEYRLATAKNVEAGRSQGIHFLHGSEVSMWPGHAEDLISSLLECVPDDADTEIWMESTGKGFGNWFQIKVFDIWQEGSNPYFVAPINRYAPHMPDSNMNFTFAYHHPSKGSDPGSDWIFIFIPWFVDTRCQRQFETAEIREDFIKRIHNAKNKKEDINYYALELQKKYKLSYEQLYWREHHTVDKCSGKIEIFNQENPTTVIDGFRTKGSNHYPKDLCDMVERQCLPPIVVGNVMRRMGAAALEPHPNGHMSVWERYDRREPYFMTVDAAGGKREIHRKIDKEPDKTVIDVWNHRTGRQAAQWYGHVDYDMISDVVLAVGEMYGNAVACVELNNHGYTVVSDLSKADYPMYYWKPGEAGWLSNKKTKPEMADGLLDGCRNGIVTIRCRETVEEMRTYVEIDGRYGAESGCKDDRVTTAQIANQMMIKLPRVTRPHDNYIGGNAGMEAPERAWMAA